VQRRFDLYGSRQLSPREFRVVQLIADGKTNDEIAGVLGTSVHVVKNWTRKVYDKLGMHNRVEVALWYVKRQHEQKLKGAP
jgi:two-component system nitrate/nitrite response regulator NarL